MAQDQPYELFREIGVRLLQEARTNRSHSRLGSGIASALEACQQVGASTPTVAFEKGYVKVSVFPIKRWEHLRREGGAGTRSEVAEDFEAQLRLYRDKTDSLHAGLPVAGFVTQLKVPIDIEDLYVPLRAMVDLRNVAEETFADAAQAETALRDSDAVFDISLTEAFHQSEMRRQRGLVILGDPGPARPPT